jgi:hypothetical protein
MDDAVTPEKQQILFDKYPALFEYAASKESRCAIAWGITCDDGWFDLIDTLCASLEWLVEDRAKRRSNAGLPEEGVVLRVVQIKEKFGTLRFYTSGVPGSGAEPNPFMAAIRTAEALSGRMCETCGGPAKPEGTRGWWRTECEPCKTKRGAGR